MADLKPVPLMYRDMNIQNHVACYEKAALGPADPRDPSPLFWEDKMFKWHVSEGVARTRLCMNCEHYDDSPDIMEAMIDSPLITEADLPFNPPWATIDGQPSAVCSRWHITCSALRTCDDWEPSTGEEDPRDSEDILEVLGQYSGKAADINFKPTEGMASEAARGLKWKEEGRAGGTRVGLARANQLVKRENLTAETVMRMYSFFKRHEVDQDAEGFSPGEEGYPSPGRVAWALWGGNAGYTWATKKRNQILNSKE